MKDNVPTLKDLPLIILTFILVLIPWTFFRAADFDTAVYILHKIATDFSISGIGMLYLKRLLLVAVFLGIEWLSRRREHPLQIAFMPAWARYIIYLAIIGMLFMFGEYGYAPFIYFQF